jgi:ABC-type lipoprotein export system ATPase subunit
MNDHQVVVRRARAAYESGDIVRAIERLKTLPDQQSKNLIKLLKELNREET